MTRFLYRSGSDRTRAVITESIRADLAAGKRAILLVPEQETVSVERRMLEELPPAAQLSFEVLNFTRLANRTFRTLGALSHRYATPAATALLMWRTLRELAPALRCYGRSAADIRLCRHFLATEAQCKAYCVGAEELLRAADDIGDGEPLADKLADLGLVLSSFESAARANGTRAEDDLTRAGELLLTRGKEVVGDTAVYVDSFTDFTAQEQTVLRALLRHALTVTVAFPLTHHKDTGIHLASAEAAHTHLARLAREEGRRVFFDEEPLPPATTAPEYLARHIFDLTAEPAPLALCASEALSLHVAPDPYTEAEAAALEIHRLVRSGSRYRDIAVVVRDANAWVGILDTVLEREGIPCFLSEKTDVTVRPLFKLILQALRIHVYGWREEDVLGYLKTGLVGVSPDDVNMLETYLAARHVRGARKYAVPFDQNPDGYTTARSARGTRILESANRAREAFVPPLLAFHRALDEAKGAAALARALGDLLQVLHVPDQLREQATARLAEGARREAEELARLYGTVVDALDTVASTLGDLSISVQEFTDALTLVFSTVDIGTIPTAADEVTVGSASMLRTDRVRHVLLLGLNAGEFPKTVSDDGLLTAADRQRLAALGIELATDRATASSDELFYVARAMAAPRETLWLSYSKTANDGRASEPSLAVERMRALFPDKKERPTDATDTLDRIYTPAALLEHYSELNIDLQKRACTLLKKQGYADTAAHLRERTKDAPSFYERAISEDLTKALFEKRQLSPSQLESFASCQFAYYCSYILRLREEASDTPRYADTGTFLHYVFEHVIEELRAGELPDASDTAAIARLVKASCDGYRRELIDAGNTPTPSTNALFARLEALATLVVSGLCTELADSSFTPALLEFDLKSLDQKNSSLIDDGENPIVLSGKIDRVDVWRKDEKTAYVRVADYKTGSKKFDPERIQYGFGMQMPLYLFALCDKTQQSLLKELGLPPDTKLHPAGVTYLSTAIKTETTAARKDKDAALTDAAERLVREGVVLDDPDVLHAMSASEDPDIVGGGRSKAQLRYSREDFDDLFFSMKNAVENLSGNMKSGLANAYGGLGNGKYACDYCAFDAICRKAKKSKKR